MSVPTERLRAAIRLLYPEEMTPIAKSQLESLCEPEMPCCDYRDHGFNTCSCPEHPVSALHPFGYLAYPGEAETE